ncbi:MAG: glycosyltransferase family 2 protein, partial [Aliifodinibius sp.]|nr:glycosyltransferase family 2 protein [Fodinibius sp.]NIV10842.1 glycosyltransferase family 2 protein [Fodinibius sp.]NIY24439.1 glycosyltransferase family 2 protein [Fodinibius sp.]
ANNYAVSLLDDIDWVALLNPDAVADSKWLESLEEATRSYPNAWSFASRMNALDRAYEIDGAGDCYHVSGFAWRR